MMPWSLFPLFVAIFAAPSNGIAFSAILLASTPELHAFVTGAASSTSSQITNGPVAPNGLAKRQLMGNTCGYVSGNPSIPFFCPTSSTCYLSLSTAAFGDQLRVCCQSNSQVSCETRDDCVGYYDTRTVAPPTSNTLHCAGSSNPYCQTYTFPNLGIVQYGCGGDSDNSFIPVETYPGEVVSKGSTPNAVLTVTATQSGGIVTGSTVSVAVTVTMQTSGSSTLQSSSPQSRISQSSTPKKNTPIGAIVGGVIAGLIVVGVTVLILFKIHKQKARPAISAPIPAPVSASSLHPERGNAGQVSNGLDAHAADGSHQPGGYGHGPDMTASPIRDGYYTPTSQHTAPNASPQLSDTSGRYSTQPMLPDGSPIAEAGGEEVEGAAVPAEKSGEPIFEAPSGE